MSPVVNAVVAAAGLGSRLGLGMPKAMIELAGQTLLSRLIIQLEKHVSQIHVVVGYREELIIEHCMKNHPKVVLARNPDYRTTNTAQSYAIGAKYLRGKTLFMDADILLLPSSLKEFLSAAANQHILIGLTEAKTENAVFIETENLPDELEPLTVGAFSRQNRTAYEWANIVTGPNEMMENASNYVFEHLSEMLPLPGHLLQLSEIDTSEDFKNALVFAETHGLETLPEN